MYPKITKRHEALETLVQSLLDQFPEAERLIFPETNQPRTVTAVVLFRNRPQLLSFDNIPVPQNPNKPAYRLATASFDPDACPSVAADNIGSDLTDPSERAHSILHHAVLSTRSHLQVWQHRDLVFMPHAIASQARLL